MELQSIKNRFGIIGNSPGLNHALNVAVQVASTDLSVLITGESGVGKEVFSQIIHALSSRKHNSFIAVNCGAIPEGTIDSELFGHEKGSFTGAVDSRKGYFETVNGGTIFLDEVGELPLGTQARLLRVLETGEYIRVGSSKVQKTDVRVIAATNRELLESTQIHKFREDLYYRLNTVPIKVPALRDRKEDVILLFRKFVNDFSDKYKAVPVQLDEGAKDVLINYPWPGNVRELKNIAEQISVLSHDKVIDAATMKRFLPEHNYSRLPVLASGGSGSVSQSEFANERDILYKLFFDMKKDVNELKKMFFDLLQNPSIAQHAPVYNDPAFAEVHSNVPSIGTSKPVFLPHNGEAIDHHEDVEESLSIMDKEKELIVKALKKHKGKRKDAALDLGISERTLYRKLKEYDIEE
ncbi:MAG: sigma-54 dependent transcriptional regulator [Ferruginibacter sp.]|nr:sigma-54-dependent Fis family transcriptional regulator [Ferruginibacter sp.]MBN8700423.1 sigma-54-dependent Fis family transcriptional regulator [Chitinophagales bacterium]HMW27128.1 sigma-54 dependent transcriptional regulator [Ferruginibacter sp.]HNJ29356.1 sigma-54 dependent transcriptional regulator [Ferruginibacter sp.]HNJ94980.1 sigma-54 dependent transcriptional regulator [Ferruginibacter sp.]